MSSVYDGSTIAKNSVDGRTVSTHALCSLTKLTNDRPWLMVDLGVEYRILYVKVKSRECIKCVRRSEPFDILVGNNDDNGGVRNGHCVQKAHVGAADTLKRFNCSSNALGRYVSYVTPAKSYLDLCELEAYGFK